MTSQLVRGLLASLVFTAVACGDDASTQQRTVHDAPQPRLVYADEDGLMGAKGWVYDVTAD
jgi:hypothetical protein